MSLRMCTRPAPRPSDKLTPASSMASPVRPDQEVSCMWARCLLRLLGAVAAPRSYWDWGAAVHMPGRAAQAAFAILACALLLYPPASAEATSAGERSVRIVALGDSLTAGRGLQFDAAFPAKLQSALKNK